MHRTARAIFARHERDVDDWRRPHLGASIIGSECNRHLWYSFRWASHPRTEGRMLRLFERGQREEDWIVEELRLIGMRVETRDYTQPVDDATGEHPQFRFEVFGGHFAGSIDGAVLGVLEATKTWHLLEVKTSNDRLFQVLQKQGVAKAQPRHFVQIQIYMHALNLSRALYVCVCKNDDSIYTERVHYDREVALVTLHKAELIIGSPEPLTRISEDPTWFECKFCDHRPVCHLGEVERLERNCRTCLSSTPVEDGTWWCDQHRTKLDLDAQRRGCGDHLFIPTLIPWKPEVVDKDRRLITYELPDGSRVTDTGTGLVTIP